MLWNWDRNEENMISKVGAYFEHLHFQLPGTLPFSHIIYPFSKVNLSVVDKLTFLRQYEQLMNMSVSERADAGYVSVLFGVFACAARIVDDERLILDGGDGGMAMVYYERQVLISKRLINVDLSLEP